ncbi:Rhomboid protease GlpG [Anaerohalosphaera lusitana]|uniref:Rhomboid protease GlpG n=2 Tax=Anaerohalosphaera lusitana TaxID=1936003 RepID=A0A1U9NGX1_9BACT|nr:Rhomboid protease GlpG [Anaerohalosphaera lusitana]
MNVLIFLVTYIGEHRAPTGEPEVLRAWANEFMLTPIRPQLWQFISYAFLHGSFMHIFGNMYFLYMFGNSVNDRLGNVGYLCFYLAGSIIAGLGHFAFSNSPVLGASGAVAAVTGAYLVLFPKSVITVIYWFFIIGTIEVPAFWFIGLKLIVIDNLIVQTAANVAYDAHLTGYAFGIISIYLLLVLHLQEHEPQDLAIVLKQWYRRRKYKSAVSQGFDPFSGSTETTKKVRAKTRDTKKAHQQKINDQQIKHLRGEIGKNVTERNLPEAARIYAELLELDPGHVMPRQYQLDIANQLMSECKWQLSAQAYEGFMKHYENAEYAEQVELMLGILYSRYLDKPALAAKYFKQAREKLHDPGQIRLCEAELAKLREKGH